VAAEAQEGSVQANAHDAGDCGVYALVLRVREPGMRVRIGALGVLGFAPGYYCYVGSARRGLAARIARHLRRGGKRTHWHIDYLRRRTAVVGVVTWRTQSRGAECELSRAVAALADGFVPRFGSSDCPCPSHLYYFPREPLITAVKRFFARPY
jgi:sugar fermentation stimulation protein A